MIFTFLKSCKKKSEEYVTETVMRSAKTKILIIWFFTEKKVCKPVLYAYHAKGYSPNKEVLMGHTNCSSNWWSNRNRITKGQRETTTLIENLKVPGIERDAISQHKSPARPVIKG